MPDSGSHRDGETLPGVGIRHSEAGDLLHAGHPRERGVDLAEGDLEPVAVRDLLAPPDDGESPVVAHLDEVARPEPAVDERGGVVGRVGVAEEPGRSAQQAFLLAGCRPTDADLGPGHQHAVVGEPASPTDPRGRFRTRTASPTSREDRGDLHAVLVGRVLDVFSGSIAPPRARVRMANRWSGRASAAARSTSAISPVRAEQRRPEHVGPLQRCVGVEAAVFQHGRAVEVGERVHLGDPGDARDRAHQEQDGLRVGPGDADHVGHRRRQGVEQWTTAFGRLVVHAGSRTTRGRVAVARPLSRRSGGGRGPRGSRPPHRESAASRSRRTGGRRRAPGRRGPARASRTSAPPVRR